MKGIVYWTPYICMHSASVYEELGWKCHVIVACKSLEYGTFGGLNMRNVEIIHIEEEKDADALIERTSNYIHINGALKTYQGIEVFGYALHLLLRKRYFVMLVNMEQYQWWTFKGLLRRLQWFYLFNIGVGRHIKAIGCTGWTGVEAYRKAFISSKRLFDFIYSVPEPNSYLLDEFKFFINNQYAKVSLERVNFIYVGQIANRKCILELISTFKKIKGNWTLEIVGGGPQEEQMRQMIDGDKRFYYWGKLMPSQAREILSKADVLLQVSKLEGWGCTVNEALMYGLRVIVSDAVGSRALIRNRAYCGQIFKSGDWNDLRHCIESEIAQGSVTSTQREQIANEFRCIHPTAEAEYFLQILNYYRGKTSIKAKAPWDKQP